MEKAVVHWIEVSEQQQSALSLQALHYSKSKLLKSGVIKMTHIKEVFSTISHVSSELKCKIHYHITQKLKK